MAAALRQDAAYRRMDANSRAYYRACACRVAKRFHLPEGDAARKAVELAKGKSGIEGEAGYYLIEQPGLIGQALGKRPLPFSKSTGRACFCCQCT